MPTYDDKEALQILGDLGERLEPDFVSAEKQEAGDRLLEELAELSGKIDGLHAKRYSNTVWLGFEEKEAIVAFRDGRFAIRAKEADPQQFKAIDLIFNRATKRFEGTAPDHSTNSVPGAPANKRREALAVIAEKVSEVIGALASTP